MVNINLYHNIQSNSSHAVPDLGWAWTDSRILLYYSTLIFDQSKLLSLLLKLLLGDNLFSNYTWWWRLPLPFTSSASTSSHLYTSHANEVRMLIFKQQASFPLDLKLSGSVQILSAALVHSACARKLLLSYWVQELYQLWQCCTLCGTCPNALWAHRQCIVSLQYTYVSTAIFSYEWFMCGSLHLAPTSIVASNWLWLVMNQSCFRSYPYIILSSPLLSILSIERSIRCEMVSKWHMNKAFGTKAHNTNLENDKLTVTHHGLHVRTNKACDPHTG